MASQVEATLLASGARTTTQTLDPLTVANSFYTGFMGKPEFLEVTLDMTTVGTGSVTLSIEEWVESAGAFKLRLASAAIVTNILTRLIIGPSVPTAANASATGLVPNRWRVICTANNANSATYSVSARLRSS